MDLLSTAEASAAPELRERSQIDDRYKWNLTDIFADAGEWQRAYDELDQKIDEYAAMQGTLAAGAERLLAAMRLSDELGQLSYRVWYFVVAQVRRGPAGQRSQRAASASPDPLRQAAQATAWFNPGAAGHPARHGPRWMDDDRRARGVPLCDRGSVSAAGARPRREGRAAAVAGEPLLIVAERRYAALSTADVKYPTSRCRPATR